MTYSMIAQCPATGAFGAIVGTSALAVGNRCAHVADGVGAVLTQHRTDPRLGVQGLALLRQGLSAEETLARLIEAPNIGWRQLAVLDAQGQSAIHHGERIYSIHGHTLAERCIALGNILASPAVTEAMAEAFTAALGEALEERLVRALEAGRDAGGEILEPLRSAALVVSGADGMERTDLRIDRADEAAGALRTLHDAYTGSGPVIRTLALDPDTIPIARANMEASLAKIDALGLSERFPSAARLDTWKLTD